ncbi:DUF4342 domain-containing protein [Clostridium sp. CS001]|uniref:DUF4342 domain-containing protein n=1 Tax=Clostridium sp. CS001 TaxID=2880648 RepID=UPI001CF4EFC4|nr:DUF4342 domain-containing protein [Clostridium sp. CS001]MCB2291077.1 DUF4342 domain-containing protein [Clostridium sp. CS001]
MSINLDQVDELRKRANVSYEDAKNALEQCNGNLIEALVFLEKQNKIKPEKDSCRQNSFLNVIKKLIKKGNEMKLIVKKNDSVVLNISLTILTILTVVATPIVIAGFILLLVTNHKIRIQKKDHEDLEVINVFDKMSTAFNKASAKITEELKSE